MMGAHDVIEESYTYSPRGKNAERATWLLTIFTGIVAIFTAALAIASFWTVREERRRGGIGRRAGLKIRRYARERPAHCHFIAKLKGAFPASPDRARILSPSKGGEQTATLRRAEGAQAAGTGDGGQAILEGAPGSTGWETQVTEVATEIVRDDFPVLHKPDCASFDLTQVRHTRKRHSRITSLQVRRDFFLHISHRSVTIRGTPVRDNPSRFAPPGGWRRARQNSNHQPESTSDESCKEITNRRAVRAFARHGKPVLCAERCALYRRARMACHDGQNKARHG